MIQRESAILVLHLIINYTKERREKYFVYDGFTLKKKKHTT